MHKALAFPLPRTSPSAVAPQSEPAAPEVDELTRLRDKVAELEHVVALAKTRVETLGAEKRAALERALQLEAQLEGAQLREPEVREPELRDRSAFDDQVIQELLDRVAALGAVVAPSRAA